MQEIKNLREKLNSFRMAAQGDFFAPGKNKTWGLAIVVNVNDLEKVLDLAEINYLETQININSINSQIENFKNIIEEMAQALGAAKSLIQSKSAESEEIEDLINRCNLLLLGRKNG